MADKFLPFDAASVKSYAPPSPAETAAWDDYTAALMRAERTLDIQDGIAAGKAWGRWLRIFERLNTDIVCEDGSNVVRLVVRP